MQELEKRISDLLDVTDAAHYIFLLCQSEIEKRTFHLKHQFSDLVILNRLSDPKFVEGVKQKMASEIGMKMLEDNLITITERTDGENNFVEMNVRIFNHNSPN